jgi:hypothetical protein
MTLVPRGGAAVLVSRGGMLVLVVSANARDGA